MRHYENQTWALLNPDFTINPRFVDSIGAVHEDVELSHCKVIGGGLGERARHPDLRTIVRRARASKCIVDGASIGPVLFEDVEITDLRTIGQDGLWVRGALFNHVRLSGKIGRISLLSSRWPIPADDVVMAEVEAFRQSELSFYASVDWAIDISKADFRELDWRLDIPSRLVRRDPETQVVVRRERALEGTWRTLPLDPIVAIGLEELVKSDRAEMIFSAPRASKRFKDELASLALLRKGGIAEPD